MTDRAKPAASPPIAELHADSRGHFVTTMGFELDPEPDHHHATGTLLIDPYLQVDGLPWPRLARSGADPGAARMSCPRFGRLSPRKAAAWLP